MSKDKLTPMQLRALAMMARDGAILKGGGFRDERYYILMPRELDSQRIIATTYQAIRDYCEPVTDQIDRLPREYRISDAGRLALVEATLGKDARGELLVELERARALSTLMDSVVKARSAAGRLSTLYAGHDATVFNYQYGGYMAHEMRAADLLRTARAVIAEMLDEAMRAAGVEPPRKEGEVAPAPQYT